MFAAGKEDEDLLCLLDKNAAALLEAKRKDQGFKVWIFVLHENLRKADVYAQQVHGAKGWHHFVDWREGGQTDFVVRVTDLLEWGVDVAVGIQRVGEMIVGGPGVGHWLVHRSHSPWTHLVNLPSPSSISSEDPHPPTHARPTHTPAPTATPTHPHSGKPRPPTERRLWRRARRTTRSLHRSRHRRRRGGSSSSSSGNSSSGDGGGHDQKKRSRRSWPTWRLSVPRPRAREKWTMKNGQA
jgi:hypothetical protein